MGTDSHMEPLRPGDRGPAVADVQTALRSLGTPARRRRHRRAPGAQCIDDAARCRPRRRGVRRRDGTRRPSLPAEPRPVRRRPRRRGDLPRPQRGALVAWATGCSATTPSDPPVATTSSTCRTGCTSSATTPVRSTGCSGPETEVGLRTFQRDYGLSSDGTCGPATLRALRQLGRKVTGGRPQLLRQSASFVESGPHLIGRRIVVDPGPRRRGARRTPTGETTEADLVFDLASRIEGRLAAAGATVYLTRGRDQNPTRGRADRLRQRCPRRPLHLPAPGRARLRARPRCGQLLLRHRVRARPPPSGEQFANLVRREVRRAHRHARPRLAPQDLGPAADDPHARRPARLRLPLPPGRPAAAARRAGAQRRRPGRPGRRAAPVPARRGRPADRHVHAPREV